jgi:hypothetical protein
LSERVQQADDLWCALVPADQQRTSGLGGLGGDGADRLGDDLVAWL